MVDARHKARATPAFLPQTDTSRAGISVSHFDRNRLRPPGVKALGA